MFCIAFGIERPPLCVNILTVYMENASTRHGRPASRLVKSSPPALFYFILTPPPIAASHELRGVQGYKVKRQLFDVNVCH
jgi:hypothetical protein